MNEMSAFPALGEAAQRFIAKRGRLLIDGEWQDAASGETFDAIDPSTERVICQVASGAAADVDRAVAAARRAFEDSDWSRLWPSDRQNLLLKLADLIDRNAEELAQLEALDAGKLLFLAKIVDVHGTAEYFRYMAGWATKLDGRSMQITHGMPGMETQGFVLREPVGVVGQIIPWNFPLAMAAWKLGPALASGCTVVLKPAEQTPLTALRLGELILEAGFPPGVVNIVTGFGETAGAALVAHPGVDKIAFTGSTAVGRQIGKACMDTMKRVSLELGGKSPVIVLEDANVEQAIQGAANAIFFHQGQVCAAGSRLYVQESIYDRVVEGLGKIASGMKVGSGFAPDSQMGPVVSQAQMERVLGYIDQGKAEGCELVAGGLRVGSQGYFVAPTVFANTQPDATIVREEIFGPVVVANTFKTLEEAAAIANDTPYGLAASIWSNNLSATHRLIRRVKAGTVWVNCHGMVDPHLPFGGFKQSGFGRENGPEALDLYTEKKAVLMSI